METHGKTKEERVITVATRGKMYHYFSGNDSPPEATGLTRGLVAAALLGILSAILRVIPADTDLKLDLVGYLAPVVTLISFVAFGYLEKFLLQSGIDIKKNKDDKA